MDRLLASVIDAHGGEARWNRVASVLARVSMGGLEFSTRLQHRPLDRVEVSVRTEAPGATFSHWPEPGFEAHFTPSRVWINDASGALLEERRGPGAVFRSPRHRLLWDRLDVLFYAGVCLWQAVCGPFIALRSGCLIEQAEDWRFAGERWRRLRITLPADVPAVATTQTWYIDPAGRLQRIDSLPDLYGGLWPVGQLLSDYMDQDGVLCVRRLRVYPCLPMGMLLRASRLSWLDLDDVSLLRHSDRRPPGS